VSPFSEFLAAEGVREEVIMDARVGVMALHGGLEFGTSRLAKSIAQQSAASLYAVVQASDFAWHLPSTQYDPTVSPNLGRFLRHVRTVFSIHGYHRPELGDVALLGGNNRSLAHTLHGALSSQGIPAISDLGRIPKALRGQHSRNPVNGPVEAGVQLELPRSMRQPVPLSGIVAAVTGVLVGMV